MKPATISALPKNRKLSKEEMRKVSGGYIIFGGNRRK